MHVLPEIVLQKVIQHGIKDLRKNQAAFNDLFCQYTQDELAADYGQAYLDQLWQWFLTTKIPVIQAWSFNAQQIPSISIHLANESEDENKAAIGDFAGTDEEGEFNTGVFTVMLDIGIHASKSGDHVLWLYYIISYILFKHKMMAERLGLKLHTFSASDYNKDSKYMTENIWTRWVRFKCTVSNFIDMQRFSEVEEINTEAAVGLEEAWDISASLDVDVSTVSTTSNEGIRVGRVNSDDEDVDV